jgi:hypothetical protein
MTGRTLIIAGLVFALTIAAVLLGLSQQPQTERSAPAAISNTVVDQLVKETFRSTGAIIVGPDRFRYVVAYNSPDANGQKYSLQSLAPVAIACRCGIAVYAKSESEGQAAGVFSLGAVALIAQGTLQFVSSGVNPSISNGERLTVGTPSRVRLPQSLREAVADHMRKDGVLVPKIAMMVVQTSTGEIRGSVMMTANLPRGLFKTETDWANELHRIEWFIPSSIDFIRPPAKRAEFEKFFNLVKPVLN